MNNRQFSPHCCFCQLLPATYVAQNKFCFAYMDQHPVTEGHTLIIPKRHFENFFDATETEVLAIYQLLHQCRADLTKKYQNVTWFNVGVNIGAAAGQSVFHLHVHLIPRRDGDVSDPKGGVRGVIPNKMHY